MLTNFRNLLVFVLLTVAFMLSACAPKTSTDIQIQQTITTNEKSKSHIEWESSKDHPTLVFANWLIKRQSPEDICKSLLQLADKNLTLFENEINNPHYKKLTLPCASEIQTRLERYWNSQKKNSDINFKFSDTKVIEKDLKNGLFIVAGDLKPKQVILTFDDGPHETYTKSILTTMVRANVKSIFFHLGRQAKMHPDLVKLAAKQEHKIGTHSMNHRCLGQRNNCKSGAGNNGQLLSYEEAKKEILGGFAEVKKILGWVDPFFRFPYGESSTDLKKYLRDNQIAEWFWSTDSNDWKSQEPGQVVETIMSSLNKNKMGVVLMHDVQHRTAIMLPQLLKELYFGGYEPVIYSGVKK